MKRRCWRTGIDIEGEPGDVCPECGGQHWGESLLREKLERVPRGLSWKAGRAGLYFAWVPPCRLVPDGGKAWVEKVDVPVSRRERWIALINRPDQTTVLLATSPSLAKAKAWCEEMTRAR